MNGCDVFFEPMQLGRAGDWNNPRLLRKQPGERDLSRRHFLLLCESANQINHRLIRFSILFAKARDDVAEIAFVKLRIFGYFSGKEAFPQRTERKDRKSTR